MSKFTLETKGLDVLMNNLRKVNGDVKKVTEDALRETHTIITHKAEDVAQKAYYPAGGKYSSGRTHDSVKKDAEIVWKGNVGEVPVGYSIRNGGLPSIFMIYGTPRYMKVQEMYNAFYGRGTKNEVAKKQKDVFYDEIHKLMGL